MTTIFDAPEEFAATALAGFCRIYPNHVRLVTNGVVRATTVPKGKVSVVVGGGSGHYPAFAGYVGPGMADAAVAGDVFASPSTAAAASFSASVTTRVTS
jgi:dihydroxyacetone kinase